MTRDDALTMAREVTGLTLVSNGRKMTDAQIVVMCQAAYERGAADRIEADAERIKALEEENAQLSRTLGEHITAADAKIDELGIENGALEADAERWRWWCANAKERLLDQRRAQSEIAPDMRTHWVGPVLICSGPVGGHMTPSEAADAARGKT